MEVKVKKLYKDSKLPTRGTDDAAAYDVYAYIEEGAVVIDPHKTVKISTGLAMTPPKDFFIGIYARSGLSTKEGLRPGNCVGVCDVDYTGPYIVALHNDFDEPKIVKHGERIAQIMLEDRFDMNFLEVEELEETKRSSGGFGSTGK